MTGSTSRRVGWTVLLLLSLPVAGYALSMALLPGTRTEFVSALFTEKGVRAFGHLAAGGLALVTGAVQFSSTLRWERPAVHRVLGLVYLVTVLVSGVSAVALAPTSNGGIAGHLGFGLLGTLWLASTGTAFLRVRDGDFEGHRRWMIRSYALCLAAVTLRLYLPLSSALGIPFADAYPAIAWLCWVPNLVVAEWIVVGSSVAPLARPGR